MLREVKHLSRTHASYKADLGFELEPVTQLQIINHFLNITFIYSALPS